MKICNGVGFSPRASVLLSIIPRMLHIHLLHVVFSRRTIGTFPKIQAKSKIGEQWINKHSSSVYLQFHFIQYYITNTSAYGVPRLLSQPVPSEETSTVYIHINSTPCEMTIHETEL